MISGGQRLAEDEQLETYSGSETRICAAQPQALTEYDQGRPAEVTGQDTDPRQSDDPETSNQ